MQEFINTIIMDRSVPLVWFISEFWLSIQTLGYDSENRFSLRFLIKIEIWKHECYNNDIKRSAS